MNGFVSDVKPWIEALRLRTLPVSVAGVLAGCAVAVAYGGFCWLPALICLVFAVLAQIISNLANEYFDFQNGIDRRGRVGFRRGLTEGDISPVAMRRLILILVLLDCAVGCSLVFWGGVWLIAVGILIMLGAFAYSAGPWPLSQHGLGDELVIVFYGVVPVTLSAWLQCGDWSGGALSAALGDMWRNALMVSLGVGLLGVNVLTVNNIRDAKDDAAVGKRTKAVIFGVPAMRMVYALCCFWGVFLIWFPLRLAMPAWSWMGFVAVAVCFFPLVAILFRREGAALNKVLKFSSLLLLAAVAWCLLCVCLG